MRILEQVLILAVFAIISGIFMLFCANVSEAETALVLNFMLFACLVWYWLLESDLVMKHFRGGGEFDGNLPLHLF